MLRKIIFCIGSRQPLQSIKILKKRIGSNGKVMDVYIVEKDASRLFLDGEKENILFVADNKPALEALKADGSAVIAFWHEGNATEDLSSAAYAVTDIKDLPYSEFVKAYLRVKGEPWEITETDRCLIREMKVEDVDSFYEIYKEPSITYYMEGLFKDPEEEREYTREYIKKIYGFYGYGLWSIVHKESGDIIGRAGLSWREGFDIPELGFVIAVPYQRKGYAYEVCFAILQYGKKELGFDKVQALVETGNEASVHLCAKLGFQFKEEVEISGRRFERYIK